MAADLRAAVVRRAPLAGVAVGAASPLLALLAVRGRRDWALAGLALGAGVTSAVAGLGAHRAERRAQETNRSLRDIRKELQGMERRAARDRSQRRAGDSAAERLATYRHERTRERLDEIKRTHREEMRSLARLVEDLPLELGALANLFAVVDVDREMPHPDRWAASHRTLLRLTTLALALPDGGLAVEAGSGTSTLWMALACRQAGKGRVVALEHDEVYARRTREALESADLTAYAEVRSGPLESFTLDGEDYPWYAERTWRDLAGINVLFVDGPPAATRPNARYPAVPLLGGALAEGAFVVLDDADRGEEKAIAARWVAAPDGPALADRGHLGRSAVYQVAGAPGGAR